MTEYKIRRKRRRRTAPPQGEIRPPDTQTELTVAETATYLGRSIEQVRRYLRDGALVGYRAGQQWFVPAAAAETFKERHGLRREGKAMEDRKALLLELRALREELRQKYGTLDTTDWVQEARQGLR